MNWIKHVIKQGSREHVISYHGTRNGAIERCSEKNCEINKPKVTQEQAYGTDCRNGTCE